MACQTQKQKTVAEQKAQSVDGKKSDLEVLIKSLTQLTSEGVNSQATFANSENEIFFISSQKTEHEYAQLYHYNFSTRSLNRVTYSDSTVARPLVGSELGKTIYYVSSSDEEKENPNLLKLTGEKVESVATLEQRWMMLESLPPFEIYHRDLLKDKIERLKRQFGTDLLEDADFKEKKLLVSSYRQNSSEVVLTDLTGKTVRSLMTFSNRHLAFPRFSPDKKQIAWVRPSTDGSQDIVLGDKNMKNAKKISTKSAKYRDLAWSSDGQKIAFSSNFSDPSNFDIYILELSSNCVTRLTFDAGLDIQPQFSSDGAKLLITSNRNGSFQIYYLEINQDATKTCL